MIGGFSLIWMKWILTSMLRIRVSTTRGNLGDWYTLHYNSSPVFMYSTFSTNIAGSVLKIMSAFDRV